MMFNVIRAAKSAGAKVVFFAKDKSPEICFIGGVAGVIAAGYFTWNAKAKCEKVLEEHRADMERIQEALDTVDRYTIQDAKADKRRYGMKAAVGFAKIFAPIVLLTLGSFTLFGKSTLIYKGRYLATAAVCAEQNKYIKQLEAQIGKKKLEELEPKTLEEFNSSDTLKSPTSFFFDSNSKNFERGDGYANRLFLMLQEQYWNDKLQSEGVIFGNQVIKALDLCTNNKNKYVKGTKKGQTYGWSTSEDPAHGADGCLSFGVNYDLPDEYFEEGVLIKFNWDKTPILGRSGMSD